MNTFFLAVGAGILAVAFVLAVRRDGQQQKRERQDKRRVAREIVVSSLKREPSPPIDLAEAMRRRAKR